MSVDANVLINERIREELRAGKTSAPRSTLGTTGLAVIIDGHVTVLISGLILAQYGTGPVKGFAVTLIVGIIVQPVHRRVLHAAGLRLVGPRRQGQAPERRRGVLGVRGTNDGVLQAGTRLRLHGPAVVLDPA